MTHTIRWLYYHHDPSTGTTIPKRLAPDKKSLDDKFYPKYSNGKQARNGH
jgi:hypothetical protein